MNINHPILEDFNKILLTLNWSLVPPHTPALGALAALELAALGALQQEAQRPRQEAQRH
jgi:hypothetical protein